MIDKKTLTRLAQIQRQADQDKAQYTSPEIVTGFYAVGKVKGSFKISNGRTWWDDPVVVADIHQYADGTVFSCYYVEGVPTFGRWQIQTSDLQAVAPAELPKYVPVSKVVLTDHRKRDDRGHPVRVVYDLREVAKV